MKLKKFFSLLVIGAISGTLFTGCGDESSQGIKLGMITNLNASEQKVDEILKTINEKSNANLAKHTTTFYKNLSNLQMTLESDGVNEISTYDCVAKYLVAKNPKLEIIDGHGMSLSDSFCFALLEKDTSLKKNIDKTIAAMKKDGTLDKLTKEYITDVKSDDPPAVEIQHIDGADTIKIAVTGDLPPLDLVLADGKPAGFNTALLAEIGKRLNKNIEIIDIDGDARAATLSSGKADVIFWAILPVGDSRPKDIDTPAGVILSEPYFTDKITHVKIKK